MKASSRTTAILIVVSSWACGARQLDINSLAGCYALSVGTFTNVGQITDFHKPPAVVRLDTTKKEFLFDNELDHRTIVDVVDAGVFFYSRDAAWRLDKDTLSMIWSSAFTGAEIRVSASASRMHGHIEFFSDQIRTPMPKASATLTRRACG